MSTGPKWTVAEMRALMTDAERDAFDGAALTYCPTKGGEPLRAALASMYGADPDEILVFNGGAEALLALFFVRGEPGANVVVPTPSFAPFVEVPLALGVETRRYALRFENGFALDVDEIMRLTDARTKLILVNTPHNPSGALADEEAIRGARRLCAAARHRARRRRGLSPDLSRRAGALGRRVLARDRARRFLEVIQPAGLAHRLVARARRRSGATSSRTRTAISRLRRAFSASCWPRSRHAIARRSGIALAASARGISRCSTSGLRHTRSSSNGCGRAGSMTAFPRLRGVADARPFCVAAAERGVLLALGDGVRCAGAFSDRLRPRDAALSRSARHLE